MRRPLERAFPTLVTSRTTRASPTTLSNSPSASGPTLAVAGVMAAIKVLHYLDVLKCNHGGFVELFATTREKKVAIQTEQRVVTDQDLYKRAVIGGCSVGCKKIVSIEQGLSKDLTVSGGEIPVLSNIMATTNKGCTVTHDPSLIAQLSTAEGRKNKKYIDSVGKPTVGVGFNLAKDGARKRIEELGLDYDKVKSGKQTLTDEQIDKLFDDDRKIAQDAVRRDVPDFDNLDPERQKALTDMAFNMGSLTKFPAFVKAVNAKDWAGAAREAGLNKKGNRPSKWVKQVGKRAKRIIAQIKGEEAYAQPQ